MSRDKQAEKGVSLDAQRAKIEAYAALYDLDLVDVVVDAGVSAKTLDRPGLNRALDMLRKGPGGSSPRGEARSADPLRLRPRKLVEKFFAAGKWALLSVGDQIDTRNAAGRLVLNVRGFVSQWEREAIGERTAQAMQHKAACGEYIGGDAPCGFRVDVDGVRIVEEPGEQAVLEQARALRAAELSLRAMAGELTRRGFRSRAGKPFVAAPIGRMMEA